VKPLSNARQLSLFTSSFEISVSRAARLLNTSPDTIVRMLEDHTLKGYQLRPGGWWKVSYDSVVAYRNHIRKTFALDSPTEAENSADPADSALVR
jgi:excisionase family DNA binding protein